MINILVEKMKENEMHLCLQYLYNAALRLKNNHIDQWGYWLDPPKDKIDWVYQGILNGEFYKVLDDTGEMQAMFRLLDKDELYWGVQQEEARYIHSLVVSDTATGKNLGKLILQNIEQKVKSQGISLLRLDCNAENPKLCQYYENQGFLKVGTVKMPYSLNNLYEKNV